MADVVKNAAASIAQAMGEMVAERLERELRGGLVLRRGPASAPRIGAARQTGSRPRTEITKWVADNRARRVPKFVIKLTGLDTKKKIVAKYGEDATFEVGHAAPRPQ
jgi:hypothetical protein